MHIPTAEMPSPETAQQPRRKVLLPSWLISLVLHAGLLVLMALTLQLAPRGTGAEVTRTVGVVLKHHNEAEDQEYYEGESDAQAASAAGSQGASSLLEQVQASDPSQALPSAEQVLGPGSAGGALGAAGMLEGPSLPKVPTGGKARTSVFGIESEGYKFVYVFDRSGSMGGTGRNALERAKAELLASLASLGPTHQFQIIFYNENPTVFNLTGQPGRLVFGNEANKGRAVQFIRGIVADGGTHHESALLAALNLKPDVIFFLTDADQPVMSPGQLEKIRNRNGSGTTINTIEFGLGPRLGGENFLGRLARQNGGGYTYIDITLPYEPPAGQQP
jgi:hypothetical protein